MASTVYMANKHVATKRRGKKDGRWQQIPITKPKIIDGYNSGMLSVDKSDQLTGYHNVLHKCVHWWKTLLFHCTDTVAVNCHVIVQVSDRKQHPEIAELSTVSHYDKLAFCMQLVQQLLELEDTQRGPCVLPPPPPPCGTEHQPERVEKTFNCKKC